MDVFLKPLLLEIKKINRLEKKTAEANANEHKSYLLKCNIIDNQLTAYNYNFIYLFTCFCFVLLLCYF